MTAAMQLASRSQHEQAFTRRCFLCRLTTMNSQPRAKSPSLRPPNNNTKELSRGEVISFVSTRFGLPTATSVMDSIE